MTPIIFNLANSTGDLVAAVAIALSERGRDRLAEFQSAIQETEAGL